MSEITNIRMSVYGNYKSGNYGAHCLRLDIGYLSLWISYDTVVAAQDGCGDLLVSKNCWGPTTGKHLNAIDGGDKKARLPRAEFEAKVAEILAAHGLNIDIGR